MADQYHNNGYPESAYLDPARSVYLNQWASTPAIISRAFIFDDNLSLKEKLVYTLINAIMDNIQNGGEYYNWLNRPEENASRLDMSLDEYTSAIEKLHDFGYLTLADRDLPPSPTSKEIAEHNLEKLGRDFHLANYLRDQKENSRQDVMEKPSRKRKGISPSLRLAVYKADGYRCVHCGSNGDLTVDHIFPVALGGTNDRENLQTLCRPCNSAKGTKWEGQ